MKYQKVILGSVFMVVTLVSCGGKNNSGTTPPIAKPNETISSQPTVKSRTMDIGSIQITNARVFNERPGVTTIKGLITAQPNAVMPCTLKNPIELKRPLNGNLPLVALRDVVVANRGISKGTIESFGVSRNGKQQAVIGLALRDDKGAPALGQLVDYVDTSVEPEKCTQMLSESYQFITTNQSLTRRSIHITTVLKGDEVIKTSMLLDETRILGVQLERKQGANIVDHYCITDAKLASLK